MVIGAIHALSKKSLFRSVTQLADQDNHRPGKDLSQILCYRDTGRKPLLCHKPDVRKVNNPITAQIRIGKGKNSTERNEFYQLNLKKSGACGEISAQAPNSTQTIISADYSGGHSFCSSQVSISTA